MATSQVRSAARPGLCVTRSRRHDRRRGSTAPAPMRSLSIVLRRRSHGFPLRAGRVGGFVRRVESRCSEAARRVTRRGWRACSALTSRPSRLWLADDDDVGQPTHPVDPPAHAVGDSLRSDQRRTGRPCSGGWISRRSTRSAIAVIVAVYIGFAVADGRPRVIVVEVAIASMFVVLAVTAVTGTAWLVLVVAYAGHGLKDPGSTAITSSPTRGGGRHSAWSSTRS